MNHCEVDVLLDLARGAEPSADDRVHLESCPRCTQELQSMRRLSEAGSLVGAVDARSPLVAPPASVWDRIQSDLSPVAPTTPLVAPARRRPLRLPVVAAAAAAAGLVVGGLAVSLLGGDDPVPPRAAPAPVRVADGQLAPFDRGTVSGVLRVEEVDSARVLTVTFAEPARGTGYVEAWLLDPRTNEMIGLGVLGPRGGTVTLPAETDLDTFTTVDISREPLDGNPAHSDDSIARGTLRLS